MRNWNNKLEISDVFHDDSKTLDEKVTAIIERIRKAKWFDKVNAENRDFEEILDEMKDAGTDNDVEWFDSVWDAAYDIFDSERIWVVTR